MPDAILGGDERVGGFRETFEGGGVVGLRAGRERDGGDGGEKKREALQGRGLPDARVSECAVDFAAGERDDELLAAVARAHGGVERSAFG